MFDELKNACRPGAVGGFLPGMKQIANVAALPGIVWRSVGLPDVHSGYGFAIGNMAAFDMNDPKSIVSPGGVGFDINCGVRLLRTNLFEEDVSPVKVLFSISYVLMKLYHRKKNKPVVVFRNNLPRACLITFLSVLVQKESYLWTHVI